MSTTASNIYSALRANLRECALAPTADSVQAFKVLLRQSHYSDPLRLANYVIDDPESFPAAASSLSFRSWLIGIRDWREQFTESDNASIRDSLLYVLWENFHDALLAALRDRVRHSHMPRSAGLLAFVNGARQCIIFDYTFVDSVPELRPIDVIDRPRSLFDFWGATTGHKNSPVAQNALKAILTSGHKITYHRDTLVHVDRRSSASVFGPTIDTIILGELLAQQIFDSGRPVRSILEIGTGSGLLSALCLRNARSLASLVAVDIDLASVACAGHNCHYAHTAATPVDLHIIHGAFDSGFLRPRFDLCVCNPPYIPLPPEGASPVDDAFHHNRRATGGVDLLRQLLQAAPSVLEDTGTLALITSHLALPDVQSSLPPGFSVTQPFGEEGIRVIFDVDSVVTDAEWLEFLVRHRGLEEQDGIYFHRLHAMIIARSQHAC